MAMGQQDLVMFNVAAVELLWPKNEHSSMILSKKEAGSVHSGCRVSSAKWDDGACLTTGSERVN